MNHDIKTYAIITDDGFGFESAEPRSYINARTAMQARKAFLARHNGACYANAKMIKATKISDQPTLSADQNADDWLPGGKLHK